MASAPRLRPPQRYFSRTRFARFASRRRRCGVDLWEWAELLAGVARRRLPRLRESAAAPPSGGAAQSGGAALTTRAASAARAADDSSGGGAAAGARGGAGATPARAREDVLVATALLRETLPLLAGEEDGGEEAWDELEDGRRDQLRALRRELGEAERALHAEEGGHKRKRS